MTCARPNVSRGFATPGKLCQILRFRESGQRFARFETRRSLRLDQQIQTRFGLSHHRLRYGAVGQPVQQDRAQRRQQPQKTWRNQKAGLKIDDVVAARLVETEQQAPPPATGGKDGATTATRCDFRQRPHRGGIKPLACQVRGDQVLLPVAIGLRPQVLKLTAAAGTEMRTGGFNPQGTLFKNLQNLAK